MEFAHEPDDVRPCRIEVVADRVDLGPVARREHDRLADRAARRERPQGRIDTARLEVEPFADLDWRGAVTDADEEQTHDP